MSKKKKKYNSIRADSKTSVKNNPVKAFFVGADTYDDLCVSEYTSLDKNPEILTACEIIAKLIGSMTIHLMQNSEKGDFRIINELSRKIDIDPIETMTRSTWMEIIVMNLLLYGDGNSVVVPHTYQGIIKSLEPIAANRVSIVPYDGSYRKYRIYIDGIARNPSDLLHFVFNPDKTWPYKGAGLKAVLSDVAKNLKQAAHTENAFMSSKWKPSIIVKVDALTEEFAGKSGRKQLLSDYVEAAEIGEPWLIPANQFEVEQIRPLSLADLAINDTVKLDKQTVASIVGVPPFTLGVGTFNRDEWNNFITNKIGVLIKTIDQEMTKKMIANPKWYLKHHMLSLYDYSVNDIVALSGLVDKGVLNANEIRDRLGYEQVEGLSEFKALENYLPVDQLSQQKKVVGNE